MHCTAADGWISFNKKVYNISSYMHKHPGGIGCFVHSLGFDVTEIAT
jgi:cytochrome b involved in lipid metabolism